MKKQAKYWLLGIGVCVLFLLLDGVNFIVDLLADAGKVQIEYRLKTDAWRDAIAVMIPTVLSYFVFKQSEIQQIENEESQKRLERMNQRLLENELKSNLGYFVPVLYQDGKEKRETNTKINYYHPLDQYIRLENRGNDIVFVYHEEISVDDVVLSSRNVSDICFLNYSELSEAQLEPFFSEEILMRDQIDVLITLSMKNSRGYSYKQNLMIGFQCKEKRGLVNKFNMTFQEETTDAH